MIRLGAFAVLFATSLWISVQAAVAYSPAVEPHVTVTAVEESGECVLTTKSTLRDLVNLILTLDDEQFKLLMEALVAEYGKAVPMRAL